VPVAYTCGLLEKAMKESKANTFLIDGFPRNQDNLDGWNKQIGSRANIRSVLFLECDDNNLNLLKKIDASKPPDEVFTQVESFIQKLNIQI